MTQIVLKDKNCQPRPLYLAEMSLGDEGDTETSPDKIWENPLLSPALQRNTGVLQAEMKRQQGNLEK